MKQMKDVSIRRIIAFYITLYKLSRLIDLQVATVQMPRPLSFLLYYLCRGLVLHKVRSTCV